MQRFGLLVLLSLVIAIARLRSLGDIPEWDIATYGLIAEELLHGRALYTDIWDMKPPAIFYTYAVVQRLVGFSNWSVYILSVSIAALTLIVVAKIADAANFEEKDEAPAESKRVFLQSHSYWAALFFAVVCIEPFSAANMPNTESFINLFMTLSWLLLLRVHARRGWNCVILAGACAAWASMYKHVAFAPAGLLAIAHIIAPADMSRRRAFAQSVVYLVMIPLGWLILFAWFAATGRAQIFWDTVFVYPRFYAGSMFENLAMSFTPTAWQRAPLAVMWPIAAMACLGLTAAFCSARSAPSRRFAAFLLAMLIGAHVSVALPGKSAAHYYQLWFGALSIAAGLGAATIVQFMAARRHVVLGVAFAVLCLTAAIAPQASWYSLDGEQWSARRYGKQFMDAAADMRTVCSKFARADDVYIWGEEPWLYVVANRRARYAGLWKMHCLEGPMSQQLTQTTLSQLQQNPPKLFVFWAEETPADHPIVQWALANYVPMDHAPVYPMRFYVRR